MTSQVATTTVERLEALAKQLRAALGQVTPLSPDELPEWLWDEAWTRTMLARELASPDVFTAWRLGLWAQKLPVDERATVFDHALDAFEALIPTPIGPGNDAGPFCDFAHELSLAQTRRALGIVERVRTANWGPEATAATHALARRLAALGHVAEAAPMLSPEEEEAAPHRAPEPDLATCAREWNALLTLAIERAQRRHEPSPVQHFLTSPQAGRLLRRLGGAAAVDLCRAALLRTATASAPL